MTDIADLRGLLGIVERSDWREFYLRLDDWSVFMARPGGGSSPMLSDHSGDMAAARDLPDERSPTTAFLNAPHIATFLSALAVGSSVEAGDPLARIELLGETIDLASESAGVVTAVLVDQGMLVEYDQQLVELTAS